LTLVELRKITKFARSQGILRLKTQDIEIEFSPDAIFPSKRRPTRLSQMLQTRPEGGIELPNPPYTDEEILLWSSPALDPGESA
jgi:hypothetical protein